MGASLETMPGGAIVVTRFDCPTRRRLIQLIWWHWLLRRHCRRKLKALVDVKMFVSWHNRSLRSVSLWSDAPGIYGMGGIDAHVRMTRMPAQRGIATCCGIFRFAGEWRNLMFGAPTHAVSPLTTEPLRAEPAQAFGSQYDNPD